MKSFIHNGSRIGLFFLVASLIYSCQMIEFDMPETVSGEVLSLSFTGDPMSQYNVPTRTSDAKTDDEKRINQLHVFFFDYDGNYITGSYLTGYKGVTGAIETGGYIAPGQGATLIKIDRSDGAFDDEKEAGNAIVYAVANVETSLFRELDDSGRPQILQDIIDEGDAKSPMEALESISYKPGTFIFSSLPDGMPMVGSAPVDLTGKTGNEKDRIIELKALMARIDVSIQLDSDVSDGMLPSMLLTSWTVRNLPTKVSFTSTPEGGTTVLNEDEKTEMGSRSTQYIYNKQGEISFSFYMFENMQQPTGPADYPPDIEEYQKQRYKPERANADAAYVELQSEYTTYNNATYTVSYKLYLGGNHTDNFEVKRNHQYKNNIIIKGLTAQDSENGEYTYDARVNIKDQDNKYYISILRERNHDAHFCVTPMDVYFFDEGLNPSLAVSFLDNSDMAADGRPWIRMEKIPAENMSAGTLPAGMTTEDHLEAGSGFTAGHGKRKYFTTNLVTETLAETGKNVTVDASRDRIYFYIDENLSDSQERTAVVQLTYLDDSGDTASRTLEITQTHFLKVQVYERDGNRPDYDRPYTERGGIIYMEQYEEYLDHYDPLDKFATEQIYDGLEWGLKGERVSDDENYIDGLECTNEIIQEAGSSVMNLNQVPRSAAEYCYNRNKREDDGSVLDGSWIGGILDPVYEPDNRKYFLPGIRQMEDALTQYYPLFPEFQGNFYWSSAAGKPEEWYEAPNRDNARATKVNEDGSYVGSDVSDDYPDGGDASRDEILRIRAFRIDLDPVD